MDPVEAYGYYEKEMQEQSDMIVVCYHGGFEKSVDTAWQATEAFTKENQGSQLLETYPSINIMLSGHQHRSFATSANGVICTQPKNNGITFSKIVIDTDKNKTLEPNEVVIHGYPCSFELINTDTIDLTLNKDIESIFTQTAKKLEDYLDTPIGFFEEDILIDDVFSARKNGHPFTEFLHIVQLSISNADFSANSIFDTAIGFKKQVTIRDVLINYPYPNTLKVLEVSGHNLKKAIEKSATYFVLQDGKAIINPKFLSPKIQNYNYDTYGGLDYTIDISKDFGERVTYMGINGVPLDLDKTYSIVMNNYRASNSTIYPSYKDAKVLKDISIDMSEIIIEYIQSKGIIQLSKIKNYQIIGE